MTPGRTAYETCKALQSTLHRLTPSGRETHRETDTEALEHQWQLQRVTLSMVVATSFLVVDGAVCTSREARSPRASRLPEEDNTEDLLRVERVGICERGRRRAMDYRVRRP